MSLLITKINFCWICNKIQIGTGLCINCWKKIIFFDPRYCSLCSNPYANNICGICNLKILTLMKYNVITSKLILRMKYNYHFYLGDFFIRFITNIQEDDYTILYVPHYGLKQITTSVNSSLLLARSFQKRFGGEILHNILYKNSKKRQKDGKNYEERLNNGFNIYDIRNVHLLKNKKVILIDDVLTTGSTVSRCASLIKRSECLSLTVVVIAKT